MAETKEWTKVRAQRMIKLAKLTAGNAWNYTEGSRRGSIVRLDTLNPQIYKHDELWEDCSSGVTGLAFAAGLPDPSGNEYRWVGNTGTIRNHLKQINSNDVVAGDFIEYHNTERNSEHIVLVISGKGHNATVWSFGSNPHPRIEPANYRTDYLCGLVYASPHLGLR